MAVLLTILFQSIHAYEHHSEQIEAKYSQHHSKNKVKINNKHSISEKCFSCDFNFYQFTTANFFAFEFHIHKVVTTFFLFSSQQHPSFFAGSFFSLRAPPIF
jgi:hypothetical protein